MQRIQQRQNKPVHTVVKYNYTMEDSRDHILTFVQQEKTLSFERLFDICENRLHAIFLFLSMLELVQQNYMNIMIGEGRNNFIVEFNPDRPEDEDQSLFNEDGSFREIPRKEVPPEGQRSLFDEDDEEGPRFKNGPADENGFHLN
jgi:segregation and condensation protein A